MPTDNPAGFTVLRESEEIELLAAGDGGERGASTHASTAFAKLKSTSTDATNTPTTTIRAGNLLATKASDGLQYPYSAAATDGTQNVVGVLPKHVNMLRNGVAADKPIDGGMLTGGLLRFDQLVGSDKNVEETLIRRGFRNINADANTGFLLHPRGTLVKGADYTVLAADHGLLLVATAAVNFTLPTLANGLCFMFHQAADANLVITAAADKISYADAGGAAATSLTFSTANKKMGSTVIMRATYLNGTLLWLPMILTGNTVTAA